MLAGGGLFLALAVASLDASSFFLHNDNPTQHLAGWLFLRGVWAYSGNKALVMWIMAGLIGLFGPHPIHETILLTALGVAATMAYADLSLVVLRDRRWALLSTILWLSLSSTLFYFRIHLGYPLACYLIGLACYVRRRFLLAGIGLALAVLSHTVFLIPVALWVGVTSALGSGPRRVGEAARLLAPLLGLYLLYEYIALRFYHELWHTAQNYIRQIRQFQEPTFLRPDQPLTYLWYLVKGGNGIPAAWFLTLALLAYPLSLAWGGRTRLQHAVYLAALGMCLYLVRRTGIARQMTFLRTMGGTLPLLVMMGAGLVGRGWERLRHHRRGVSAAVAVFLSLAVGWHLIRVDLGMRRCSQTSFPAIASAFEEATRTGKVIIYFGNPWVAAYYRDTIGAATLINPHLPDLAFETANPFQLRDLSPEARLLVIAEYGDLPSPEASRLEAPSGRRLTPPEQAHRIPYPNAACPMNLAESWDASTALLRAAQPLSWYRDPALAQADTRIWEIGP